MRIAVILILILVASSCVPSNLVGTYKRTYKISTSVMTSNKMQKLIIKADSSFIWTDYKDEFSKSDSSIIYGLIRSNDGSNLYVLKDTLTNNIFCLFKKEKKLYFYNCKQGKKYTYSNPFIKDN